MTARPVIVDLFAGGGGASEGIRQALGCGPTVAINHDPQAIEMHAMNHPGTLHLCEDMLQVAPFRPKRGRGIDLLWASPDCKHFSKAKGGKPLEKRIRLLAWTIVEWARAVTPRVIILENVEEFEGWGPLDDEGYPIKARKGETFREFVAALQLAGYRVEWRLLVAADYGAPTSRRRLFLVARCDGQPIRWPEPTHGPGREQPWRAAAECIDWSIPMLSIFASKAEAQAWNEARKEEARARGEVVSGRDYRAPKRPLEEATQRRIAAGVVRFVLDNPQPFVVPVKSWGGGGNGPRSIDLPLRTITTSKRGEFAVVDAQLAPFYVHTANGERPEQSPRARSLEQPHTTICASGSQGAVVSAFLAKHQGSGESWSKAIGQAATEPMHTITATDTKGPVTVTLSQGAELGRAADVAAFLIKFYGQGGQLQRCDEPLHTIPTLDRFGLVTCSLQGEQYVVTDIGMRMLQPHELALAQGFGPEYILTGTKGDKVARIGNSVCPPVARAVVAAQFGALDAKRSSLRETA